MSTTLCGRQISASRSGRSPTSGGSTNLRQACLGTKRPKDRGGDKKRMLTYRITLEDVHRVRRPGIDYVYTGPITVGQLYQGLSDGLIRYSPRYQRGFRQSPDADEDWD